MLSFGSHLWFTFDYEINELMFLSAFTPVGLVTAAEEDLNNGERSKLTPAITQHLNVAFTNIWQTEHVQTRRYISHSYK